MEKQRVSLEEMKDIQNSAGGI